MNKKEQSYYNDYLRYCGRELHDCYKIPSIAKCKIWKHYFEAMCILEGHNLTVISFNTNFISLAFEYVDKQTGVCMLYVATPSKDYTFSI